MLPNQIHVSHIICHIRKIFINVFKAVRQLIAQEVPEDGICGFLWEHLVNDVQSLSASLDRSEDDVLLTVHLVLSEIVWRATNSKSEYR